MSPHTQVVVLVGPKGSGKTHIGGLVSSALGVRFLRVEPIFLDNMRTSRLTGTARDAEGYARVAAAIEAALDGDRCVFVEATGASDALPAFLQDLRSRHEVLLVRIRAPLATCLERVHTRDQSAHIPVSDDRVEEINTRAAQVELDWDLEIDNSGPASPEVILDAIRELLARRSREPTTGPEQQ
jgi:shikimate kinase